jgi:hypothetical protein
MSVLDALFKRKMKQNERMSVRRRKRITFLVTGQDENGFGISEEASTEVINQKGGRLVFSRDVRAGGVLYLKDSGGIIFQVEVRSYRYDVVTNLRTAGFKILRPVHRWQQMVLESRDQSAVTAPAHAYCDNNWLR